MSVAREELQFLEAEHVVVPITYSTNPDIIPSRMSRLAFDVACYIAILTKADRMMIAGEQSHSWHHMTTGDLLAREAPKEAPEITILRDPDNRLLNTAFQGEKLAEKLSPEQRITLVGWGFHETRVLENLFAHTPEELKNVEYTSVESVIDELWQSASLWNGDHEAMRQEFRSRYGFEVDWPQIKERGLRKYEKREQRTRLWQHLGKSGWFFKLVTRLRKGGRYDDLSPTGEAIHKSTY